MREQDQLRRQPLKEQDIVINYAIHTHPLTQLKTPDLLDEQKDSLFQITCQILYAALPLILCFQLNILPTIINIYIIGNSGNLMMVAAVGLGSVFANIFGYLIIKNMAVGFSIVCTYFQDKQEIGYMYQKTLGINFFLCILITPILYLSDKMLRQLGFDPLLVKYSTEYVWALVPSFYLFSFYQTTQNYLQSQKIIYPPLIIGTIGIIFHYWIAKYFILSLGFGITGAAWAKNLSDALSCLVLYIYIIKQQPAKQSWIEWNICATNNVHKFLAEIATHQVFTYFQQLAFELLCIFACHISTVAEVASNFTFYCTYTIFFYVITSISHCLNRALALSIEDNNVAIAKKKVFLGIMFAMVFIFLVAVNINSKLTIYDNFFINSPETTIYIDQTIRIFTLVLIVTGFQKILQGIMKTMQVQFLWKIIIFCIYFVGLGTALIFGFSYEYQLNGIWGGWFLGCCCLTAFEVWYLLKVNWEEDFLKVRAKYAVIQENIRESRIQIATRQF